MSARRVNEIAAMLQDFINTMELYKDKQNLTAAMCLMVLSVEICAGRSREQILSTVGDLEVKARKWAAQQGLHGEKPS